MDDTLVFLMNNRVAGTISRRANNLLHLEYDRSYQASSGATPVSVSMPLAIRSHADTTRRAVVSNFLQGLLPDDDATRGRWAAFFQARATSPFFLLATRVGRDCAGAVSFCPPDDAAEFLDRGGRVLPLTEHDVAEMLRAIVRDRTAVLGPNFRGQFSLAGAQAKIALVRDDHDGWGQPQGTAATNRILKPSSAGWSEQDINEHVCLAAAAVAGLRVARSEIVRFEDQEAIVLYRYDRAMTPAGPIRVHQEDMCQALGLSPLDKYEFRGGPSAKKIASLLRTVMPRSEAEPAIRHFIDALAWNWIIGGTDAHAKNYSLLLSGGDVRLAPLYDISSMLPYIGLRSPVDDEVIHERNMRSAMKIGGHYELVPVANRWPTVAAEMGLPPDEIVARVRDLTATAADAFSTVARQPSVRAFGSALVGTLVDRATARADRCLNVLR